MIKLQKPIILLTTMLILPILSGCAAIGEKRIAECSLAFERAYNEFVTNPKFTYLRDGCNAWEKLNDMSKELVRELEKNSRDRGIRLCRKKYEYVPPSLGAAKSWKERAEFERWLEIERKLERYRQYKK